MNKHELTKELLIAKQVRVELDENGQPLIYQPRQFYKTRGGRHQTLYVHTGGERKWEELRPQVQTTAKHKYGEDKTYLNVPLRFSQEPTRMYPVAVIVYIWFTGNTIPRGYDIDHIDNNPLNNNPDNLQLLSRKENINKRGGFKNQYDIFNYQEFGEEYIKLKPCWKAYKESHSEYWSFRNWYYKIYKGDEECTEAQ